MEKRESFFIISMRKLLEKKYPCGYVPRKKIAEATGGFLNPRTMANEDCRGEGIAEPIKIKGYVCYEIEQIIEYFKKNSKSFKSEYEVNHDR